MNSRADASTSTDEVKGRPLCLFYFTHPFGVLSPEPPTVTNAPLNIARTYVNMEPVPPFWTSSSSQGYDTTSTRPSYDLGNATVHRNPVNLVRNYDIDFRRESISSSLFSSDMWFSSSADSRKLNHERRVIPYHRILPPLRLPTPRDLPLEFDSSDDVWPKKCLHREKFSLPPLEFPVSSVSEDFLDDKISVCDSDSVKRYRRVLGVKKQKRKSRLSSVRRMITRLMRRSINGMMGKLLDHLPAVENCCFCIPLRVGVIIISLVGLCWASFTIFCFTPLGSKMLSELGMSKSYAKSMRYVHGAVGVLLAAVHIILLLGAIFEIDAFCEVYIWFMVILWIGVIVMYLIIGCTALKENYSPVFGTSVLVTVFLSFIIAIHHIIIVANYTMTIP